MCRFLMIRASGPVRPGPFLDDFARAARAGRSYDGDWQGDGWGISWLTPAVNGDGPHWKTFRSLRPVWEEAELFREFPHSRVFLAHARSSSFPEHKGAAAFNQPYVDGRFAFVFNGLVRGMRLSRPVPGDIGSQKIWALLRGYLATMDPAEALRALRKTVIREARDVQALNVGLSDGESLFALCQFSRHPDYYTLHVHSADGLEIICSEPLGGFAFRPAELGESMRFPSVKAAD